MKSAEMNGETLDYTMYCHACKVTGQTPSKPAFDAGYAKGQFHFHQDKTLLVDLLETYRINVQYLAEEWLASNSEGSAWGETPLIAACRLILVLQGK